MLESRRGLFNIRTLRTVGPWAALSSLCHDGFYNPKKSVGINKGAWHRAKARQTRVQIADPMHAL